MNWRLSNRFGSQARRLADRHYSRQKHGTSQFVAPGKPLVLIAGYPANAVWVTLRQKFIDHDWKSSWGNVLFRNESSILSSTLIREAVMVTRAEWGEPPADGIITFVDPSQVRHKRDPGRCYLRAGFLLIACLLRSRKLVFQLPPEMWPESTPARADPVLRFAPPPRPSRSGGRGEVAASD